jgi:AcrR family transcriptional regulator
MDNDDLLLPDSQPSRADAVKNRELLLDTAQRLFAQQGVSAVSMSMIAREAGLGKGTLYRHFESKIELCLALLDKNELDLQNRTLKRLRTVADPLDNLRWLLAEIVHYVQTSDDLFFTGGGSGAVVPLDHQVRWWWRQTFIALLKQLNVTGDVEFMADVLYVMVDMRSNRFQRLSLGYDTDRIINGLYDLLDRFTH